MSQLARISNKIRKVYPSITVSEKDDCICLKGQLSKWEDVVKCGSMAVSKHYLGVLNDITLAGHEERSYEPAITDKLYDGEQMDVLVIGGGVVGCATLRELTRYNINAVLVEKESDVGLQASSRNDGAIHVGIDLNRNSKKCEYLMRANPMYEELSQDLDFKFQRTGQYLVFPNLSYLVAYPFLRLKALRNGIKGVHLIGKKQLKELFPNITPKAKFAVKFDSGGSVCPYGMTIAFADNAIINGGRVWLDTIVKNMEVSDDRIISVTTNRGKIYPKVVINCAGVFADRIADMAKDRFYTIHPRKGTNSILDKNSVKRLTTESASMYTDIKGYKKSHTKGGGVVHTVDNNVLIGPDAIEIPDREDTNTSATSVDVVLQKQKHLLPQLERSDIITYFTGVRASTYEEDFVVTKGKKTHNIVHGAGIQSPGLSAAPSIAQDLCKMAVEILSEDEQVSKNNHFNPIRIGVVDMMKLSDQEKDALIKMNPDYGEIVCRCEGISKGEIIDALALPLKVNTIDGIKRRVRAGMGRCQGGFCQPNVLRIIAENRGISITQVAKRSHASVLIDKTKE